MIKVIHQLSSFFFYVLGLSLFAAYALFRNDIAVPWPAWWLQVADLPFLLSAVLYGGISLYKSLTPHKPSPFLAIAIGVPLAGFFVFCAWMNFTGIEWPL